MASQRRYQSAAKVDLDDVAQLLRSAAAQIRRDASARYDLELERAAALEAAAVQVGQAPAVGSRTAETERRGSNGTPPAPTTAKRAAPPTKRPAKSAGAITNTGTSSRAGGSTVMDRVVAVVCKQPRRQWTTAQVAQAVGAAPTTVATLLARATERGLIRRAQRGHYQAA
jgi:hypothetical protein